jgi:hypothetical protein
MPISNFPAGFAAGVNIRGMPLLNNYGGKVFWVDSVGGSDGNKGTFDRPFATIDKAFGTGFATANRGDIVAVKAGHDENPTASITMDVAGTWLMGLGWGTHRPTVTFGAAGAELAMSAAGCKVSGIRFDLGTVATTVTNAINITADGCIVEDCETVMHATSQFTNHLTATDAQWVGIYNNRFKSLHTAGSTSGIVIDGCDDAEIIGNTVMGHFGEHALDNTTPASADEILRAVIAFNVFHNDSSTAGDLAVQLDANATGVMFRNAISGGLALASNVDYGNCRMIENYLTDAADVTAVVSPTTAAA